jgi:hypothetical protein
MEEAYCPNYDTCRLVKDEDFIADKNRRLSYIDGYCKAGEEQWCTCKRLITKNALNFCPDFVLPDTRLTPDEIIDKFDNENIN